MAGSAIDTSDVDQTNGRQEADDQPQAETFADLLGEADFFHSPDEEVFADLRIDGHRETHPVRGGRFKNWIRRGFRSRRGRAPDPKALEMAREEAAAIALDEGEVREVFVRSAMGPQGEIFIDLGDPTWRAVEVSPLGWRIVDDPPVRFRRSKSMRALPTPSKSGSLDGLRSLLNLADEEQFVLVISFLLGALHPRGPYPFLALRGEQGSAKTTCASILESQIDPGLKYPRAMPKSIRDAVIAAHNTHLLSFDNVSNIDAGMSDFLCRLSSGASSSYRGLYTDNEEALFSGRNPVILNGITEIVSRPDLAQRCIFLTLEPIPASERKQESEVMARADRVRGEVLGALLDAMSHGLARLPKTHLAQLPRMADFAMWATACETRWFESGAFMAAYAANQRFAVEATIQASPFMAALWSLLASRKPKVGDYWEGTCGKLLEDLNHAAAWSHERKAPPGWPTSESGVSRALDRAAGPFRQAGLSILRGTRKVTILREEDLSSLQPSFDRRSVGSVKADEGSAAQPLRYAD